MSLSSSIRYDHDKIAKLFFHIEQLGRKKSSLRKPLFNKLKSEVLILHEAEERVLYNSIEKGAKAGAIVQDLESENVTIKCVIKKMDAQKINSAQWHKLFLRLKKLVIHHAKIEEKSCCRKLLKHFQPKIKSRWSRP